nr:SusC/RagA family TonB-linked outer membrane protein [uncultured Draconibacterium sp.]
MEKILTIHGLSPCVLKMLKVMKLTTLFLLTTFIGAFASESYSQTTKLTLKAEQISLEDFLVKIEEQSEFRFFYTGKIDVEKKVSGNFRNQKIMEILNKISEEAEIKYEVMGRQIILSPANSERVIKSIQNQKTVSGKVLDSSGAPLPGVTIALKGTTNGTISNVDGTFVLNNIPENATLVFSFVGMKTQEISVEGTAPLNIIMKEDFVGIEEVVAIGYGVQRKDNISGAINSLDFEDLHTMAGNDVAQALQGKAPVFAVKKSGKPGEETSLFLRGVGTMSDASPLWIVDGIQEAPLENFQDVESIQILKDAASAAIYGVQAANGVVLVTTRKARKDKIRVNYHGYTRINQALGLPDMLGTQEYIDLYKARWKSNNPTLTDDDMKSSIKSFYFLSEQEVSTLPNTDWVDAMFRTGTEQVHSLSVSGGKNNSTFYISALHESDEGTLVNTSFQKSSVRFQFEQQPASWLKLRETFHHMHSKDVPFYNDYRIWQGIFRGNPAMKVYDSTNPMGTGYGYFSDEFAQTIDWQGSNPMEDAMTKDFWEKTSQSWGNLQITLTPIKGLTWVTNVSGTSTNIWNSKFRYNCFGGVSINSTDYISKDNGTSKQFAYEQGLTRSYLLNSYASYTKKIKKSEFGIMVGTEVYEKDYVASSGNATYGIPSQDLRTNALTMYRDGTNSWDEGSRYSQFGRLSYSYDNKYLMTANFRNDATDKFAPGNRNAFFPSVSLGWNLANESFFSLEKINNLKLRMGVGELGNSNVPSNLWRQEYTQQTNGTWIAQKVVNENITWEKTFSVNAGIDLGLFSNALTATIDFYNKKTRDALLKMSLPSTTGFDYYYVNRGIIRNRGIEISLGYAHHLGDLKYALSGTMAYNKNKVLDVGNASYLDGGSHNRTYNNGPVSALFGYVADGLYQSSEEIESLNNVAIENGFSSYDGAVSPGDIKFKDINNDGTISSEDQTSIGNPWPKIIYGSNINLEYKGFELIMNWQGVYDIDVYNDTKQYMENMYGDYNSTSAVKNAWSSSNTSTSVPRLGNSAHNYNLSNSYMVEDASYLRLKNLQLGYDLAPKLRSVIKLEKLKIYTGVENALTFTKFKGFDPEFMSGEDNYTRGVYSVNQYPQFKSVVLGVQLVF